MAYAETVQLSICDWTGVLTSHQPTLRRCYGRGEESMDIVHFRAISRRYSRTWSHRLHPQTSFERTKAIVVIERERWAEQATSIERCHKRSPDRHWGSKE